MKTDLIILGAQKCATTSLFRILSAHPQIAGSRVKETDFFSMAKDWRAELPSYEALFDARADAIRCEASPSYTFFPHRNLAIWDDLYAYNRDLKLIYLVRDPADRLVSAYRHSLARGYTRAPIERFVLDTPLAMDVTRYYTQIAPYVQRFGRDRVLILRFTDVTHNIEATLRKVGAFIGLDLDGLAGGTPVHANASVADVDRPPLVLGGAIGRALRKRLTPLRRRMVKSFTASSGRTAFTPDFHRAIIQALDLEIGALETLMERELTSWRSIKPRAGADVVPIAAAAQRA